MQLGIVVRRVRGLLRLVRHLVADPNLTLSGYLQDVSDHLDEAHEDAVHLIQKSIAIVEAHHRIV